MNTILVPTDFSTTAQNAANYALALAKQLNATKIILYNAYQAPVIGDAMASTVAMIDFEVFENISKQGLLQEKNRLSLINTNDVQIEILHSFNELSAGVEETCKESHVDLVVMGITPASALEETLIGSNAVTVSKHTRVPVVIVPKQAAFTLLKKVLLTCDFKDVSDMLPTDALTSFLNNAHAELHVLHIEKSDKDYSSETVFESVALETLIGQFNPQYHFVNSSNFTEAVDTFALANEIDMLIVLPKKHNLIDAIFHKSHTKSLAFHSHIPLVLLHD